MPRFAFVNGQFWPHQAANIPIEDRGLQFGDGVYEVVAWLKGKPLDLGRHLDRLQRSLNEISIAMPYARKVLEHKIWQLVRKNRIETGLIYLQITRGVAPRNHLYPNPAPAPTVIITSKRTNILDTQKYKQGIKAISLPDIRWGRCDIKTVNLLPNCMAKQEAALAKAGEALFLDKDQNLIEGASSSCWMINHQDQLITCPIGDGSILPGITRAALIGFIDQVGLNLQIRKFSLKEAYSAKSIFITAASTLLVPIIALDDHPINQGVIDPRIDLLRNHYLTHLLKASA